jgi:DNA-binding protein HU-beta
MRSVSMRPPATHETGHFYFAQTGHSHFAATDYPSRLDNPGSQPLASASQVPEDEVIKLDLVNAVVAAPNISRTKAEQAVETIFESLKQALGRSQRIELLRFGVFSVKPRKTGIGRNPRTGEEVNIPPGKAVRFKPGKELQGKDDENKPE